MIGTRLKYYLIEEKIGEGGMGVVYKGHDIRLLRPVAVKILPEHLVSDEKSRLRLVQEARAASALNHPNICTVYDIGEESGVHFIVMEFVEGQTLREILAERGFLPEAEVVEIAIPVCDALSAAHKKGIIHRDIKPENIMVTPQGRVKVMDFGLAKLKTGDPVRTVSELPEEILIPAQSILKSSLSAFQGTAAYMAPEQIRKKGVDERTDIFSLGVLLYELITGTPPFVGGDSVAVMKSILKEKPKPISETKSDISPEMEAAVLKALAKRPCARHESTAAMREELQKSPIVLSQTGGQRKIIGVSLISGTFLLIGALFLVIFAIFKNKDPSSDVKSRQTTRLFSNARTIPVATWPGFEDHPSISPEGKKIAFAADRTGSMDIWIMNLEDGSTWNLTPDSPARDEWPRWSPEGERIAFQSSRDGGRIFVADLSLRTLNLIADDGGHPAWSPDGQQIAYAAGPESKNLFIVNLSAGQPFLVFHSAGADYVHSPSWSHDGRWIAFALGTQMKWNIYVVEASGKKGFFVTRDEYFNLFPNWDRDDGGIFFRSDRGGNWDIWFRQLSLQNMQPIQEAAPITFGAEVQSLHVSRDGERIAYSRVIRQDNLFAVDLEDPQHPTRRVTNWGRITIDPSISPDGTKIVATSNHQGNLDLWMCNRDGSDAKVIYRAKDASESPTWSPDGKRILFVDGDASKMEIKILDLETGKVTQLTHNDYQDIKPAWSPDGKWIAYTRKSPETDIWIMSSDGRQSRQLTFVSTDNTSPRFSPDGKTIAFTSRRDGYQNLWIIPFEGGTPKQLSFNQESDGLGVCWSPDGKYIYYAPMHGGVRNIWKVSPDGEVREQVTHFTSATTHVRRYTSISTDGKELFFATLERVGDVWLMEGR